MRRFPTLLSLVPATALLALVGCGDGTMTASTCEISNNCLSMDGEFRCVEGYEWADPEDETNLNCIDRCSDANFCEREGENVACQEGYEWGADGAESFVCVEVPPGLPILGNGSHIIDGLSFDEVADSRNGLNAPRDVAFHPQRPEELWSVSYADSSAVVLFGVMGDSMTSSKFDAVGNTHFLARPAALAFGENGNFATAQEEDRLTQGPVQFGGSPEDFMGPTLWTSNMSDFDGGHHGHLDMLHNSPNSTGIAWEVDNTYWVYDGYHQALVRYAFNDDHGPGGAYHGDGDIKRYVEGQMGYIPGVSSHLVYVAETQMLYAADSGNNRIVMLDTTTGTLGASTFPNYDGGSQRLVDDAELTTVIDGASVEGMERPSGLELQDGMLFVGDNATGRIFAFTLEGEMVDYVDTGLPDGALQGMAFDSTGRLFMADSEASRVMRITPAGE